MSKANQNKTFKLAVDHVVRSLERVTGDDENLDAIQDAFATAAFPIDTSHLFVDELMSNPKVQKAFKRFIADTVGTFEYEEENGEGY